MKKLIYFNDDQIFYCEGETMIEVKGQTPTIVETEISADKFVNDKKHVKQLLNSSKIKVHGT